MGAISKTAATSPDLFTEASIFLAVTRGDVVIVEENQGHTQENWWMGEIIHIVSGARGAEPSLFQVACIDTGAIKTVNADQVTKVVQSANSQHKGCMRVN